MGEYSFLRITTILLALIFCLFFLIKKNNKDISIFSLLIYFITFITFSIAGLFPNLIFKIGVLLSFSKDERAGFYFLILICLSFLILAVISISESKHKHEKKLITFVIHTIANSFKLSSFPRCDLLILIPSYNELPNLKYLLKKVPKKIGKLKTSILVIDDGSKDETKNYLRHNQYNFLTIPYNSGQGMALRVGYKFATLIDTKFVVTMDADNQHLPSDLPKILKPLITKKADVVIGSRILGKNLDQQKIRSLGITFFSLIIYILTRVKINDISSGFKCFRIDILKKIDLQENQYQSAEFLLSVIKENFKVVEIPISFYERKYGLTKKGVTINYALGFFKSIILFFIRR